MTKNNIKIEESVYNKNGSLKRSMIFDPIANKRVTTEVTNGRAKVTTEENGKTTTTEGPHKQSSSSSQFSQYYNEKGAGLTDLINKKEEFVTKYDEILSTKKAENKVLNKKELAYLAEVMKVDNPELLKHLNDDKNAEAKKLYRQLSKNYHPDYTKNDEFTNKLYRIVQAFHDFPEG